MADIKKGQNDFGFCPRCASRRIQNVGMRKWLCPECGFDLYNNVASAVGLVIFDDRGRLLLEKRAKEPRKGFLALPGGFVDPNETAEEACFRECREETGVLPQSVRYLCSFPNTYEYKEIVYKTCDLFFEAVLSSGELKGQEGEVLSFEWRPASTKEEIDAIPFAFESARKTLHYWLEHKKEK